MSCTECVNAIIGVSNHARKNCATWVCGAMSIKLRVDSLTFAPVLVGDGGLEPDI